MTCSPRRYSDICLCIWLLLLCSGLVYNVAAKRHWVGSKLGLGKDHHNEEAAALRLGIEDYERALNEVGYAQRKPLLCATFIRASLAQGINLVANMATLGSKCDWAVVVYAGEEHAKKLCQQANIRSKSVLCGLSSGLLEKKNMLASNRSNRTLSSSNSTLTIANSGNSSSASFSIPKSVLYFDLLPVLSGYKRLFLLDEDISLLDFDIDALFKSWDCSFPNQPPPLIVQPLVDESTQFFNFVSVAAWENITCVSSAAGYVEQQVPLFDAQFFEWFVRRVLSQTRDFALERGVDWGHDRSWCSAASSYAEEVLQWGPRFVGNALRGNGTTSKVAAYHVCGIITSTSIHHLNTRSMAFKRNNRVDFRTEGFNVVQRYINLFPTWVHLDVSYKPNPLSKGNKRIFPRNVRLNSTCLAQNFGT
jgi:hypothetical protein